MKTNCLHSSIIAFIFLALISFNSKGGEIVEIPEICLDSLTYRSILEKAIPLKWNDLYDYGVVCFEIDKEDKPDIMVNFIGDPRALYWHYGEGFYGYTVIDDIIFFITKNSTSKKLFPLKYDYPLLFNSIRKPKEWYEAFYILEYQTLILKFENGEYKARDHNKIPFDEVKRKFDYLKIEDFL